MSLPRLVPPAGAPLPLRAALSSILPASGKAFGLSEFLQVHLGIPNVFFTSSGRVALTVLLKALQRCLGRREVVIPAYTCFSVPSAVVRAELQIRLCDVDPKTLDLDLNALRRLDLSKTLCIVSSGLYGMPGDLGAAEAIARNLGIFLVDDAAQCLGATAQNRACGTFGDAGLYSLGRGKSITTMGGGILLTERRDVAQAIDEEMGKLRRPLTREVYGAILGALAYSGMLQPSRYWTLDRVPFLELGASHFDPHFPMATLSAYQTRLAMQLFPLLESANRIRRAHAHQLRARIEGADGIEIPRPVDGASPIYLRLPILARNGIHRSYLCQRLREVGIGASASYPTSIGDIPGIERHLASDPEACPGARSIAQRILTLPTHAGVTPRDVEHMGTIIRETRDRSGKALR